MASSFMALVSASFVCLFSFFLDKKANLKVVQHCLEKHAVTKQGPLPPPSSGLWGEECREKTWASPCPHHYWDPSAALMFPAWQGEGSYGH